MDRFLDRIGLGQFLIERVFAARRQRQRDRGVPGEVADEVEVVVAERGWRGSRATAMTPSTAPSAMSGMTIAGRSPTSVKPSIGYWKESVISGRPRRATPPVVEPSIGTCRPITSDE